MTMDHPPPVAEAPDRANPELAALDAVALDAPELVDFVRAYAHLAEQLAAASRPPRSTRRRGWRFVARSRRCIGAWIGSSCS
jgi:hypothetical protein